MIPFLAEQQKAKVYEPLKNEPQAPVYTCFDIQPIAEQLIAFTTSHTVQPFAKSVFSHSLPLESEPGSANAYSFLHLRSAPETASLLHGNRLNKQPYLSIGQSHRGH